MARPEPEWWAEARRLRRAKHLSYTEIGRQLGRSPPAVHYACDACFRRKLIKYQCKRQNLPPEVKRERQKQRRQQRIQRLVEKYTRIPDA